MLEQLLDDSEASRGQRDVLNPPVGDIQAAGDKPLLFETSQDARGLARVHTEVAAQLLDRGGRMDMQDAEAEKLLDGELGHAGQILTGFPAEDDQVKEPSPLI